MVEDINECQIRPYGSSQLDLNADLQARELLREAQVAGPAGIPLDELLVTLPSPAHKIAGVAMKAAVAHENATEPSDTAMKVGKKPRSLND